MCKNVKLCVPRALIMSMAKRSSRLLTVSFAMSYVTFKMCVCHVTLTHDLTMLCRSFAGQDQSKSTDTTHAHVTRMLMLTLTPMLMQMFMPIPS